MLIYFFKKFHLTGIQLLLYTVHFLANALPFPITNRLSKFYLLADQRNKTNYWPPHQNIILPEFTLGIFLTLHSCGEIGYSEFPFCIKVDNLYHQYMVNRNREYNQRIVSW